MALTALLDALRAQAAERRADELARAAAEAERIRAESRASLARRKAEHVERAARDADEAARRTLSDARSEAARSVLTARARLLARVRAALEASAQATADDPSYAALLAEDLAGALARMPPGEVVVRTRPEWVAVLAEPSRGRPGVVIESVPDMGVGFVAASPGSGVELDATLGALLAHRWPRIAVQVLREVDP